MNFDSRICLQCYCWNEPMLYPRTLCNSLARVKLQNGTRRCAQRMQSRYNFPNCATAFTANTLCFISFIVAAVAHKVLPFGSRSSGDVLVVCSALWLVHRAISGERQMLAGIAMEASGSIQVCPHDLLLARRLTWQLGSHRTVYLC